MATISYVVNAVDSASATFARIAGSADELNNQLDEIGRKRETAWVGLKGNKEAELAIDKLDFKIARLATRKAEGKVGVEGEARALLEIRTLEAALDKFGRKDVTATVKVDVDKRGFLGKLGALGGVAGGGLAGLGAAVPGLGGLLSNPYSATAAIIAALAALPFAAAAAAGGIVTALGGGMAAVGVIAAAKTKQVKAAFADLKTDAAKQLAGIGTPFNKALEDILRTTDRLLPQILAPFKDALKSIAPAFESFSKTLVSSFASPAVAGAVRDLGKAFRAVLDALRPSLPSIINSIATGIDGIAQAIRAHPRIFADLINFLGHLVGWSLQAIGALTRVAAWIVQFTRDAGHWLRVAWNAFAGFFSNLHRDALATENMLARVWDTIWRNTITRISNGVKTAGNMFRSMWHDITVIFGNLRRDVANAWDTIWRNTVSRVANGIRDVTGWFRGLPGKVIGALRGLGSNLYSFARSALNDFLRGFKSLAGTVLGWVGNFVKNIWNKVKGFFNMSPPHPGSLFYDLGADLMKHLGAGIRDHAHHAQNAIGGAVGGISGDLGGDAALNERLARRLFPWPASQWPAFRALVMAESGFNRFARNPSSGAYGIPQALPPSKLPFAGQAAGGSHAGPQLSWMFNYIATRPGYGNPAAAWAHEQAFGWYDRGGWLPPGLSLALNTTGRPERVGGGGTVININIAAGPVTNRRQLAQEIADVILEHTKTGGRLYPQGVQPR